MPDEEIEGEQKEEKPEISPVDVEKVVSERTKEMTDKISALESTVADLMNKTPVTPKAIEGSKYGLPEGWEPKGYDDLFDKVVEVVEKKGLSEELTQKVATKITEDMQKKQEKQAELFKKADERLTTEITELQKTDKGMNKDEVLKFIQDWNGKHESRITSFKDGYDIFKMQKPTVTKARIIGAPSPDNNTERQPEFFRNVDEAVARELADLTEE